MGATVEGVGGDGGDGTAAQGWRQGEVAGIPVGELLDPDLCVGMGVFVRERDLFGRDAGESRRPSGGFGKVVDHERVGSPREGIAFAKYRGVAGEDDG